MFVSVHRTRGMLCAPFLNRGLMRSVSRMNVLMATGVRSFHASTGLFESQRDSSSFEQRQNNRRSSFDQGAKSSRTYDSEVDYGIRRKGTPVMDMVELSDEPNKGNMVRAVYFGRCIELAYYPQLGPRKTDPNDPMPQFDYKERTFYRLNKTNIASLIALCEGKLPSLLIKTRFGGSLEANMPSAEELVIKLTLPKSRSRQEHSEAIIRYKGHYLPSFRHFLEFSLAKSFGFDSSEHSKARFASNDNKNSSNQNNSQRRGGNSRYSSGNTSASTMKNTKPQDSVKSDSDAMKNNMFRDEIDW